MTNDQGPPEAGLGTSYDVVVIGSGFGGGISANRLSLSGLNVLVLERGPWRDSLPVRARESPNAPRFPTAYDWPRISSGASTSGGATHLSLSNVVTHDHCELGVFGCCGA